MTSRALSYTVSRPKVLIPGLFGLGLLIGNVSMFWGLGFLALAILQASKLLSKPDLDDLLRLKADKERHGIGRLLNDAERQEILAIDAYVKRLRRAGADEDLGKATRDRGWEIIAAAGHRDSSTELRLFRQSLPPVHASTKQDKPELVAKLERELEILHATNKEMERFEISATEPVSERMSA